MEIFRLFGSIFIDNEKANKAIDDTDSKGRGLAGTLASTIGTAAKWGAGLFAAASTAVGGMVAIASKTAQAADAIDKLSERTGINREDLQRWRYAADQSGADIETLEMGIKTLSNAMDGALSGNRAAAAAFERLGISLSSADGSARSTEAVFRDVMNALGDMEQGAARNAIGADLLGRSYTELLPLLNSGSQGMRELMNRADELGLVMSEDAVRANVQFGDTLSDLKQVLGAVFMHVSNMALPVLQQFIDWILGHMPQIQNVISAAFSVMSSVISAAGTVVTNYILPALNALWGWIQPTLPQTERLFRQSFGIMEAVIAGIARAVIDLTGWFIKHWDIMQPILIGIAAGAVTFGIYQLAINAASIATAAWSSITAAATAVGTAFGAVLAFITSPIGLVVVAIGALVAAIALLIRHWDDVKAAMKRAWHGVVGFIQPVIDKVNAVIDAVKAAINWLGNLLGLNSQVRVSGGGPVSGTGPSGISVAHQAEGGVTVSPGLSWVGEEGPELLNLPRGAQVIPLDRLLPATAPAAPRPVAEAIFGRGAFEGAIILDDYGVDRLMERCMERLAQMGVRPA